MRTTTRTLAASAVLALALSVSGCGDADTDDATAPMDSAATDMGDEMGDGATGDVVHNDADTEFAQMMIVHHQGAVEMSELAIEKADTEDVRALAQSISEAQGPEIDTMTGWLESWGEDVPDETATEDMGDTDHSGMDMDGTDQAAAMEELEGVSGTEFDRRFLELMIAHHEGAVEMAQTEMDEGENADATGLAQRIVEAQQAEILTMQEMLDEL